MQNIWTIARREYKRYFATPSAYVMAFMLFLVLGLVFYANVQYALTSLGQFVPDARVLFGPMVIVFLFAVPAVTMRLLAEEQKTGTLELLLTAPVRDAELVVGKWLGAFLFILTLLAVTLVYPLLLNEMVQPGIDQGPVLTGYLGFVLMTAALVGVGVMVSSLFSNQLAAFVATLALFWLLWLMGMPVRAGAGGAGSELLRYLDFNQHFYPTLYEGILDLRDVVYYLSVTAISLFLGSVIIETRRWR
ncbi:MAG TPA: hypothetical protein ENJ02_04070 [Chloroflexi bacterium]|nr:hypothetical protein [Chloroflexota bacterium]